MFTFLGYDGVPWNNNNAEHAIKRFAKHRRDANGKFTEPSLREYLVLASVLETCEFNNVSVLDFLLSGETTLNGLLKFNERTKGKRSAVWRARPSLVSAVGNASALESQSAALRSIAAVPRIGIEAESIIVGAYTAAHSFEDRGGLETSRRKWRFEVTEPRSVSCLGGLIAIEGLIQKFDLLTRLKFERSIERRFHAATGKTEDAVITQLLYSFCAGGVSLEDAQAVGTDILFKYIAGTDDFARKSTLEDWLARQDQARVERFFHLNAQLAAKVIKLCVAARRNESQRSLFYRTTSFPAQSAVEPFQQNNPRQADKVGLHGNQCLYAIAGIAHNLLSTLKLLYLPDAYLRLDPQSLQRRVIFLPAEVLHHARTVRVRVHVPKVWQGWWHRLVQPLGLPVESA